jgi:hypothetical protein
MKGVILSTNYFKETEKQIIIGNILPGEEKKITPQRCFLY